MYIFFLALKKTINFETLFLSRFIIKVIRFFIYRYLLELKD